MRGGGDGPARRHRVGRLRRSAGQTHQGAARALHGWTPGVRGGRRRGGRARARVQRRLMRGLSQRRRHGRRQRAGGDSLRQERVRSLRSDDLAGWPAHSGSGHRRARRLHVRRRAGAGGRDHPGETASDTAVRPGPGRLRTGRGARVAGGPSGAVAARHRGPPEQGHRRGDGTAGGRQVRLEEPGPEPPALLRRRVPERDGHHEPVLPERELPAGGLQLARV